MGASRTRVHDHNVRYFTGKPRILGSASRQVPQCDSTRYLSWSYPQLGQQLSREVMSHRGGKRQRHYKELEPHERELEAKQFYDYVKENWARNRVRVSDLKQLYSDMEWQQRSTCMAFCKCFEILKRCRALKSKKRGVFVLNNGWPTSTGRNQKMLAAYYVDKELEEKKLTSYRATEQIFLRYVILELLRTHK